MNNCIPNSRAFTLVELMIVVGIVAVLTGLILAGTLGARRAAHGVGARVAAKQLVVATILYAGDHDDRLPFLDSLRNIVKEEDFMDRRDAWGDRDRTMTPLVGSFSYYFGALDQRPNPIRLDLGRGGFEKFPLFINIFESDRTPAFFEGEVCPFLKRNSCDHPKRIGCVGIDGTYRLTHLSANDRIGNVFTWTINMSRCRFD